MAQLSFEPFYIDMERRGVQLVDIGLNRVADAIREGPDRWRTGAPLRQLRNGRLRYAGVWILPVGRISFR